MTTDSFRHDLEQFFRQHQRRYLDLLKEMVDINSFTENPPGINKLGEMTAVAFEPLGFEPTFVPSVHSHYGSHLFLERSGRSEKVLGLISHLDTVYTEEEEQTNNFAWREDGDRIYGPGTIDIKGGTVMIYMVLEALKELAPDVLDAIHWNVMLDASEEDDARDFGELCLGYLEDNGVAGLVFESGKVTDKDFLIVVARKGRAVVKIKSFGRSSHAGTFHPKGANAILQLARAVEKIEALTDYERGLTVSVGTISGGTVTNAVPAYAEAYMELRAFSPEAYTEGMDAIRALHGQSFVKAVDDGFEGHLEAEIVRETGPWPPNEDTEHLFSLWEEAGEAVGLQAVRQERGGLSDANLIVHKIPVIDALGPSGANAHCSIQSEDGSKEQEYLSVSSLVPKAVMNTLAITALVREIVAKEG